MSSADEIRACLSQLLRDELRVKVETRSDDFGQQVRVKLLWGDEEIHESYDWVKDPK